MNPPALLIDLQVQTPVLSLTVRAQWAQPAIVAVTGQTGAGKTTLLRAVVGLDPKAKGTVAVGSELWLNTSTRLSRPVHLRDVGYVPQHSDLFPHLSVRANVTFALGSKSGAENTPEFAAMTEALLLDPLWQRPVATLSGGERQRVALARALARRPRLLVLDEPLAAVDPELRARILRYLQATWRDQVVMCLYVSHDEAELAQVAQQHWTLHNGCLTEGA